MESSQSIDLEIEEQNCNDGEKERTKEQDDNKGEADDEKGKGTTRAKRSMVWDHFTYVKGASSSKCPYCSQMLACHSKDNGTSGLKSHLELYCPKSPVLLRKKGDRKQATLGFKPVEKGAGGSLATHSTKFPILSQVAKHVLGMPISTVASESAFSTGGRVIDPFRSSLSPQTAEALICAQDWIRSTPVDIELPDVHAKAMEELQEKLETLEMYAFGGGPKFFEPCAIDD